jgi:hypothetical protein
VACLTSLQDRNLNPREIAWRFRLGFWSCVVDRSQDLGGHPSTAASTDDPVGVEMVRASRASLQGEEAQTRRAGWVVALDRDLARTSKLDPNFLRRKAAAPPT